MEKLVYLVRIYKSLSFLVIAAVLGTLLGGCSEGIGDPCMPETENPNFSSEDIYIEASSVQCETRVCGVFKYSGNPKERMENGTAEERSEVEQHVFCTCRCRAHSGGFATCSCPDGFVCSEDILEAATEGLRGGYCVRKGLMEMGTVSTQTQ